MTRVRHIVAEQSIRSKRKTIWFSCVRQTFVFRNKSLASDWPENSESEFCCQRAFDKFVASASRKQPRANLLERDPYLGATSRHRGCACDALQHLFREILVELLKRTSNTHAYTTCSLCIRIGYSAVYIFRIASIFGCDKRVRLQYAECNIEIIYKQINYWLNTGNIIITTLPFGNIIIVNKWSFYIVFIK